MSFNEETSAIEAIQLQTFPQLILQQILVKIHTTTIVRLRSTCSFMNTSIEMNRKMLENRPSLGIRVIIRIHWKKRKFTFDNNHRYKKFKVDKDFRKHLAAISICGLSVRACGEQTGKKKEKARKFKKIVLSRIQEIQRKCGSFYCSGFPIDLVLEMTDCFPANEVHLVDRVDKTELRLLNTAKYRSTFHVHYNNDQDDPNVLPVVRNFAHLDIWLYSQRFADFLVYIQNHETAISLKSIEITMFQRHDITVQEPPFFKIVWDACWCRDEEIGCTTHEDEICTMNMCPKHIRLMELQSQYVVFVEQYSFHQQSAFFIEKSSPVEMMKLMKRQLLSEDRHFIERNEYEEELILKKFSEKNPDWILY